MITMLRKIGTKMIRKSNIRGIIAISVNKFFCPYCKRSTDRPTKGKNPDKKENDRKMIVYQLVSLGDTILGNWVSLHDTN